MSLRLTLRNLLRRLKVVLEVWQNPENWKIGSMYTRRQTEAFITLLYNMTRGGIRLQNANLLSQSSTAYYSLLLFATSSALLFSVLVNSCAFNTIIVCFDIPDMLAK
jgi:hypothetical protein